MTDINAPHRYVFLRGPDGEFIAAAVYNGNWRRDGNTIRQLADDEPRAILEDDLAGLFDGADMVARLATAETTLATVRASLEAANHDLVTAAEQVTARETTIRDQAAQMADLEKAAKEATEKYVALVRANGGGLTPGSE